MKKEIISIVDGQQVTTLVDMTEEEVAAFEAERAPDLVACAGQAAWRVEVAGKTISGIPVKWDERSKVLLMGAAGTLSDDDVAPYVSGSLVVPLTGAQFKAIYAAMVAHTQACFVKRAEVLGMIAAGTITTKAEIDEQFATI